MRFYQIIDLKDFLEVADNIETPFKFFEISGEMIKATIWLRTALITYEGKYESLLEEDLRKHGFKKAKEGETRRIILEDLL